MLRILGPMGVQTDVEKPWRGNTLCVEKPPRKIFGEAMRESFSSWPRIAFAHRALDTGVISSREKRVIIQVEMCTKRFGQKP